MQTIYEAVGARDGLLRLAAAWHARVLADEVVSHAFSHGFHPEHTERLRQALRDYFAWATTTTMSHYHRSADDVPDDLQIPKWSWQGLAG